MKTGDKMKNWVGRTPKLETVLQLKSNVSIFKPCEQYLQIQFLCKSQTRVELPTLEVIDQPSVEEFRASLVSFLSWYICGDG